VQSFSFFQELVMTAVIFNNASLGAAMVVAMLVGNQSGWHAGICLSGVF
jgi:hypothetical protein